MLELEFESVSEEGRRITVSATFEPISDYIETQYGEKLETYWHLINLEVKPFNCHCYPTCFCFDISDNEYKEIEYEARKLASKEAA